ncbi:hypothetical protein EI94DRAFT_1697627 [Lactarius quietus]|nr:hypothetical protein EI94DRAFT_1697627 [Lactarius quietus]
MPMGSMPMSRNSFAALEDMPLSGLAEWPLDALSDINFSPMCANPFPIPSVPLTFTDTLMVEDSPATFTSPNMKTCHSLNVLGVLDVIDPDDVIKSYPEIFPPEALFKKLTEWDEQWGGIRGHGTHAFNDLRV